MNNPQAPGHSSADLAERYRSVRSRTEDLAAVLSAEDQVVQSMPDTSPTKWHRAHVTWFFETFLVKPFHETMTGSTYSELDPAYAYLFNSYYEAAGPRHTRAERGMITRPGVQAVGEYRRHVDNAMKALLAGPVTAEIAELVVLGLHHEQQHQELLLMDIKHLFSLNPMAPAYYAETPDIAPTESAELSWHRFEGGIVPIGHDIDAEADVVDFSFDNELPRHQVLLGAYELADRLVTCGEWMEFIEDGGYQEPQHWLSDGWHTVNKNGWQAPEYWYKIDDRWMIFTLAGLRPIDPAEPVSHVSFYEADAYASWAGARLPTEFEWEHAAASVDVPADLGHRDVVHPQPSPKPENGAVAPRQMFGELWQWTASSYSPYPGFQAAPGAVGEYNGKFMVNTWVLRGGCVATPPGHIRATYRNFFYPATRWHFSGIRLARTV